MTITEEGENSGGICEGEAEEVYSFTEIVIARKKRAVLRLVLLKDQQHRSLALRQSRRKARTLARIPKEMT